MQKEGSRYKVLGIMRRLLEAVVLGGIGTGPVGYTRSKLFSFLSFLLCNISVIFGKKKKKRRGTEAERLSLILLLFHAAVH
jgi:hypothetical protein